MMDSNSTSEIKNNTKPKYKYFGISYDEQIKSHSKSKRLKGVGYSRWYRQKMNKRNQPDSKTNE